MFCGKCGNKIRKGADFCKLCGTPCNDNKITSVASNEEESAVQEEISNESINISDNNIQAIKNNKKDNSTKFLVVIICILIAVIIAGVVIFVIKPGKKSNNNANDSETPGSTYTEESTPGGVTNPEEATNTLTIRVCGANFGTDDEGVLSDAVVSLYEGYDNYEGEPLYQLHSDGSGYCAFENLAGNEYAVKIECSGYEQHLSNVTVGEAGNITKYLVPIPGDNDVIFEVIWDGNHDLDLCSFNASTGEYTSVGNPMDSFGSFIYSDNSDRKYELIYLRDYASDNVRTIYVVDTSALNQGLSSTMEADGVILRAYTSSGKCFEKKAESSKSAPVWTVAYIYNGAVYDDAEAYIDNVTSDGDYAWAYNLKAGNKAPENKTPEIPASGIDILALKDNSEYEKYLKGYFKKGVFYDSVAFRYFYDSNYDISDSANLKRAMLLCESGGWKENSDKCWLEFINEEDRDCGTETCYAIKKKSIENESIRMFNEKLDLSFLELHERGYEEVGSYYLFVDTKGYANFSWDAEYIYIHACEGDHPGYIAGVSKVDYTYLDDEVIVDVTIFNSDNGGMEGKDIDFKFTFTLKYRDGETDPRNFYISNIKCNTL